MKFLVIVSLILGAPIYMFALEEETSSDDYDEVLILSKPKLRPESSFAGRHTFGAPPGSKCSHPLDENRPYTGEDAFVHILSCILDIKEEGPECSTDDTHLDGCKRNISAYLQPCTDSTSTYIPEFSVKVFESVHEYLCGGDDQNNFNSFIEFVHDRTCLSAAYDPIKNCHPCEPIRDVRVPKDVFCKRARELGDCVGAAIRTHCSERQYLGYSNTANAFLAPCQV